MVDEEHVPNTAVRHPERVPLVLEVLRRDEVRALQGHGHGCAQRGGEERYEHRFEEVFLQVYL